MKKKYIIYAAVFVLIALIGLYSLNRQNAFEHNKGKGRLVGLVLSPEKTEPVMSFEKRESGAIVPKFEGAAYALEYIHTKTIDDEGYHMFVSNKTENGRYYINSLSDKSEILSQISGSVYIDENYEGTLYLSRLYRNDDKYTIEFDSEISLFKGKEGFSFLRYDEDKRGKGSDYRIEIDITIERKTAQKLIKVWFMDKDNNPLKSLDIKDAMPEKISAPKGTAYMITENLETSGKITRTLEEETLKYTAQDGVFIYTGTVKVEFEQ